MCNFCEANEEYFVRSLATDRPIKRPGSKVRSLLAPGNQYSQGKKKKKKEGSDVGCIIHKDRVRAEKSEVEEGEAEEEKEENMGRENRDGNAIMATSQEKQQE